MSIFGDNGNPKFANLPRRPVGDILLQEPYPTGCAAFGFVRMQQRMEKFRLAISLDAGDPQNFAALYRKAYIRESVPAA